MSEQAGQWHFLTNHARVLVAIARDPATRLRDIAAVCRITERTALSIVTDLEQAGYMRREREGRRTATSSAWTAPSVIQQRQTCPSGNYWKCSPHTRARTDRQPCSPPRSQGLVLPLRVDQPLEPRLRGPQEQQLAMGERTGGRHPAVDWTSGRHVV